MYILQINKKIISKFFKYFFHKTPLFPKIMFKLYLRNFPIYYRNYYNIYLINMVLNNFIIIPINFKKYIKFPSLPYLFLIIIFLNIYYDYQWTRIISQIIQ